MNFLRRKFSDDVLGETYIKCARYGLWCHVDCTDYEYGAYVCDFCKQYLKLRANFYISVICCGIPYLLPITKIYVKGTFSKMCNYFIFQSSNCIN